MFFTFLFLILYQLFAYYEWFTFWMIFYITPQIVHNFIKGNKPKLVELYIFGILSTPFIIGLYFRGCPGNIANIAPNLVYSILWIAVYLIQILLYFFQTQKGSRFFVPKRCVPGYYNYIKTLIIKDN